ncbi:hypothetical protein Tco_1140869, partial [Tanacetum coccineum]
KPTLGLWYSRDSPFELVAYTDSDYAGATQDRKSTTGDLLTKGFDAGRVNTITISLTTVRQKISTARQKLVLLSQSMSKEVRTPRYLSLVVPLKKVGDEAVHKELGDKIEQAATTASSLKEEQESGNINKTQSMATLNEPSP